MLLAYLDEIGQTGAFVHPSHKRFSDSPAFGYGGFVIPEDRAREFSAFVVSLKKHYFCKQIEQAENPGQWELKGADLLFAKAHKERPQNLRILSRLLKRLQNLDGYLFYYAEEKPIGTPKETNCGHEEFRAREATAMRESLNRLARHAAHKEENILVLMDQINEKSRKQRLPGMYAHIYGRGSSHPEMWRILEPPMHVDSRLSTNIQFADWVCALVKRAIEYQLVSDSRYDWIVEGSALKLPQKSFTFESKLHLYERSIEDLNHSAILKKERPVIDSITQSEKNRAALEKVISAARAAHCGGHAQE